MKSKFNPVVLFVSASILLIGFSRLIPHLPNFTPVAAMAIFGGAYLRNKKLGFIIPFSALILSDLFLGFSLVSIPVYACFALSVCLGILIQNRITTLSTIGVSLVSSLVFFLVTNLPVWYISFGLYSNNFEGLIESYTAAIPFFRNMILGDLFYCGLLFGSMELIMMRFPKLKQVEV